MWPWFTWSECAWKGHQRCPCSCSAMSCSHPACRCCSGGTTIYLMVCRVVQLSRATLIVISAVLTTFCMPSSVSEPSVFISLICCLWTKYVLSARGELQSENSNRHRSSCALSGEKNSKVILNPLKLNTFHFNQFINKRETLIFYCVSMEGLDAFLLN